MAELADAPDSKSGSRKRVGVRPSLWAPSVQNLLVGAARVFSVSVVSWIVHAAKSNPNPHNPVDMSQWVAYSL
jgi:hypothetical protein